MGLGEACRWAIQQVIGEDTWRRAMKQVIGEVMQGWGDLQLGYPAGNWVGYMRLGEASKSAIQQVVGGYLSLGDASRLAIQQVIREVTRGQGRPLGRLSSR